MRGRRDLAHPLCAEGEAMRRSLFPKGLTAPAERRLEERGRRLLRAPDEKSFGVGLFLFGLATPEPRRRGRPGKGVRRGA